MLILLGLDLFRPAAIFLLSAALVALVAFRLKRFWVTLEDAAAFLDRRCNFSDALATSLYFQGSSLPFAAIQRRDAEALAATVDLAQVAPWKRPRSAPALAAAVVALAIAFGTRYGHARQLNLRSAPSGSPDSLALALRADQEAYTAAARKSPADPQNPFSLPDAQPNEGAGSGLMANRDAHSPGEQAKPAMAGTEAQPSGAPGDSEEASAEAPAANSPHPGAQETPGSQEGAPQSAQAGAKGGSSSSNPGLLSKVKDAMSNLISKLRPESSQPQQPSAQSAQQANSGASQPSSSKQSQRGELSDAKGAGDPSQLSDEESPSGKALGKGTDQNSSAKPGSGAGRQDGGKDLLTAEQLAVMGKLSELVGKRSASLTGEMTIESQSGSQQLRTGYSKSNARHAAGGGDVNRDQVPIALQDYVQQYFRAVRKQSSVKTARVGKPEPQE